MALPIAKGSSRRPSIEDAQVEEALRVLEDRLAKVESETNTTDNTREYDDTAVQRQIFYIRREIDKLWKRKLPEGGGGGDTYSGDFKVYQTEGEDLQVTIDAGRFIYGSGTSVISSALENLTDADDTYYVYFEASYSSGLVTDITFGTAKPTQTATTERFLLAEVDVASSVITEVRQIQYGEIHSTRIWD